MTIPRLVEGAAVGNRLRRVARDHPRRDRLLPHPALAVAALLRLGAHCFRIALAVGLALIGVVLWGSVSGSMLPFLLRRCGLDPATSCAPFVATLVDVTGLLIYFNVVLVVLRGTVL